MVPLEPIPETVEALDELDPSVDTNDLRDRLLTVASRAHEVVPDLVGVSIARVKNGLTFTLVASAEDMAVLDAVQYADGGPCVAGAESREALTYESDDPLDEKRWHLFSEATAAHGVRSTLTLPILEADRVVGSVNLYAATRRAFVGHHHQLAEIFGAVADGAMVNADLSFATRQTAQQGPERARELMIIEVAVGILAARHSESVEVAEVRLRKAAERAGISAAQLALHIVRGREETDRDGT